MNEEKKRGRKPNKKISLKAIQKILRSDKLNEEKIKEIDEIVKKEENGKEIKGLQSLISNIDSKIKKLEKQKEDAKTKLERLQN